MLHGYLDCQTTVIVVPVEWVMQDRSEMQSRKQGACLVWVVRGERFGVSVRPTRKGNDGHHRFLAKLPESKRGQKYLFSMAFKKCRCCHNIALAEAPGSGGREGESTPTICVQVDRLGVLQGEKLSFTRDEMDSCLTFVTCFYDSQGTGTGTGASAVAGAGQGTSKHKGTGKGTRKKKRKEKNKKKIFLPSLRTEPGLLASEA